MWGPAFTLRKTEGSGETRFGRVVLWLEVIIPAVVSTNLKVWSQVKPYATADQLIVEKVGQ